MNWSTVQLGDVCTVVSGATPRTSDERNWDGDIFWATPKDISKLNKKLLTRTERRITDQGLRSCSAQVLPIRSVLFSSRAPIGLVAINTVPMATNQGFKSLVVNSKKIDENYLYWWLKSNRALIEAKGVGATFKELSKKIVEGISLPLPPLAEQKRIAAILDKAEEIRRKREEAIEKLDQLAQSVFLEMFGNDDCKKRRLDELGDVKTGGTPPSSKEGMFGDEIPFITPGDLDSSVLPKRYLTKAGASNSVLVKKGSALVCCIGTIGKMGTAQVTSAFNQQINAVEWGEEIDGVYGIFALRNIKQEIINNASSTTLPILKKSLFQKLQIKTPPKAKQEDFAAKIHLLNNQGIIHKQSLETQTALIASLQHQAFTTGFDT